MIVIMTRMQKRQHEVGEISSLEKGKQWSPSQPSLEGGAYHCGGPVGGGTRGSTVVVNLLSNLSRG